MKISYLFSKYKNEMLMSLHLFCMSSVVIELRHLLTGQCPCVVEC